MVEFKRILVLQETPIYIIRKWCIIFGSSYDSQALNSLAHYSGREQSTNRRNIESFERANHNKMNFTIVLHQKHMAGATRQDKNVDVVRKCRRACGVILNSFNSLFSSVLFSHHFLQIRYLCKRLHSWLIRGFVPSLRSHSYASQTWNGQNAFSWLESVEMWMDSVCFIYICRRKISKSHPACIPF